MAGPLTILHLYPEQMNLYGDRGNVLALVQRARWRGITAEVISAGVGDVIPWDQVNLIFMGGGEDTHQAQIADDFLGLADPLIDRLNHGVPMLAICGAYQLMGKHYVTADGRRLPGIGYFDVWTEPGTTRAIGDVVVEAELPIVPVTLVGFENHGGRTFLGPSAQPLARVRLGQGNNGQDGTEGTIRGHAIGTYLHGSLLPKNPHLTDLLLGWALNTDLSPLDSETEWEAHRMIVARAQNH